ncbi:MAG: beta-aspartyl-peptidase (threonine type), partial [Acidobacteria bacterium]|nr:beta-aspartyl-peptidase (threonine type) [Acidobacteriota bacterium]
MRFRLMAAIILCAGAALAQNTNTSPSASPKIMLVMHGGAGTITKASMTPELEKQYRETLELALRTGQAVLAKGGTSVDAVEASIHILEDSPLFNAGKGAVFTHEGRNELDASIMRGKDKAAGAVAGVTIIRNPISAARAVMEKSPHVLMAGKGAELFATKMGLEIVDPSYFWTEKRWKSLQEELIQEQKNDQKSATQPHAALDPRLYSEPDEKKFSTVGAVALDRDGNLAAGTSTGGMTNKQYGRVGDSPIIGAGTYADNESCAVSGTGHGEYFIRWTVAYAIAARMKYKGLTVEQAANEVVNRKLKDAGGEGGVIALERKGNFSMPFNSEGMYRGYIAADGVTHVSNYKEKVVGRGALRRLRGWVRRERNCRRSMEPSNGGIGPPTGGTEPPVGGTEPPGGGIEPSDGATEPPDGGTGPPDGGIEPPSGGIGPTGPDIEPSDPDIGPSGAQYRTVRAQFRRPRA